MVRWLTAGESHGPELVAVIEGLPAGIPVTEEAITDDYKKGSEESNQVTYCRGRKLE